MEEAYLIDVELSQGILHEICLHIVLSITFSCVGMLVVVDVVAILLIIFCCPELLRWLY